MKSYKFRLYPTKKQTETLQWTLDRCRELVEHKAAWAGVTVYKVNPNKTSQICSACHEEGEHKDLSVRTHICVYCGTILDRDHNAAINILDRGLGRSLRELASQGTFRGAVA